MSSSALSTQFLNTSSCGGSTSSLSSLLQGFRTLYVQKLTPVSKLNLPGATWCHFLLCCQNLFFGPSSRRVKTWIPTPQQGFRTLCYCTVAQMLYFKHQVADTHFQLFPAVFFIRENRTIQQNPFTAAFAIRQYKKWCKTQASLCAWKRTM